MCLQDSRLYQSCCASIETQAALSKWHPAPKAVLWMLRHRQPPPCLCGELHLLKLVTTCTGYAQLLPTPLASLAEELPENGRDSWASTLLRERFLPSVKVR